MVPSLIVMQKGHERDLLLRIFQANLLQTIHLAYSDVFRIQFDLGTAHHLHDHMLDLQKTFKFEIFETIPDCKSSYQ